MNIQFVNPSDIAFCHHHYKIETMFGRFYVWADCLHDALDELADRGKLKPLLVPEEDQDDEVDAILGNYGHHYDLTYIRATKNFDLESEEP